MKRESRREEARKEVRGMKREDREYRDEMKSCSGQGIWELCMHDIKSTYSSISSKIYVGEEERNTYLKLH